MANFCRNCGGKVNAEDKFCAQCGQLLDKEAENEVKWNKYDWEKEEWEEKPKDEVKPVNMKKHILMGILLAVPFVNLGVCIAMMMNKNIKPDHRKLVKIWFILNVIGLILGCILAYFVFQFAVMDHYVPDGYQFQHSFPELLSEGFPFEMNDV